MMLKWSKGELGHRFDVVRAGAAPYHRLQALMSTNKSSGHEFFLIPALGNFAKQWDCSPCKRSQVWPPLRGLAKYATQQCPVKVQDNKFSRWVQRTRRTVCKGKILWRRFSGSKFLWRGSWALPPYRCLGGGGLPTSP